MDKKTRKNYLTKFRFQAPSDFCQALRKLGGVYHATTKPVIRDAQRRLVQWTLEPIAALIAQKASENLGGLITLDLALG